MGSFLETYDDPYVASHAGVFGEGRNYDSPNKVACVEGYVIGR